MAPAKKPSHWKLVENVVAAVERSLSATPGIKVCANASVPERVSGNSRQIDVYVEIPTGPRILRIGLEVRDTSAPVDLPEIEQLITKLKKLDIDYGCIVSRAGFSSAARTEAEEAGIELRTISEIENPDWWHVSEMLLDLRQVELLRWQVNWRPEELDRVRQMLEGVDGKDLELTLPSGEVGSLHQFVMAQGPKALGQPALAGVRDQEAFKVVIDLDSLEGGSLKCPVGAVPMPQSVWALYRLHHTVEAVQLSSFQGSEGVNAFTGVSETWEKQITVVTKAESDGSRRLSFTVDDPTPRKMTVSRRRQVVDKHQN